MNWQVAAPSKTFLVGEYIALQGGATLILTTAPRFTMRICSSGAVNPSLQFQGIANESPAGRFLKQTAAKWRDLSIEFVDPHFKAGGFGASTAQIVMLMAFLQWRQRGFLPTPEIKQIIENLQHYQALAWNGQGAIPSGADFVAQWQGGVSFFYRQAQQLTTFSWPFAEMAWVLIPTGKKLATHHYLRTLPDLSLTALHALARQAWQSFELADQTHFIQAIQRYAKELQALHLVAPHTLQLLSQLQQRPEVLAAKGCGAMGADTVLALIDKAQQSNFELWLQQQNFKRAFIGQQPSSGVAVEQCD